MIKLKHLSKKIGDLEVLKDINVEIKKGEIVSIIGAAGSGKSTLLRCLNYLEKPDTGEVIINGVDLGAKSSQLSEIRQKIAMVFQDFSLFGHLMVVEILMMGQTQLLGKSRQEAYDEAIRLLDFVGLGGKVFAYQDELSDGQKQRVAIARALSMNPDIILLDEITSALKPTMISEVHAVIRKLTQLKLTILMVTHEMQFAKAISSRIIYMDEGGIYEEGTAFEVLEEPKRAKTKAYVHRIQCFNYTVNSSDFDFYNLIGELESFGIKYLMPPKNLKNLKLLVEELLYNVLLPVLDELELSIEYSDKTNDTTLSLLYKDNRNLLEIENPDAEFSKMIITKLTDTIDFKIEDDYVCLTLMLKKI